MLKIELRRVASSRMFEENRQSVKMMTYMTFSIRSSRSVTY